MKDIAVQNPSTMTVHVPITFTVRGGRKTIMSEFAPASPQPRIDNALLKALAQAHRWRRMIENGKYASITELAKAEWVNQSYACRVLRLTLIAPAVVTEILNGRQNSDLMLKQLMKPLPVHWDQQMIALNFEVTSEDATSESRTGRFSPQARGVRRLSSSATADAT